MKAHQNITVIPTAKFHLENSAVTVRSFNMRKILLHLTPKEEPTSIFKKNFFYLVLDINDLHHFYFAELIEYLAQLMTIIIIAETIKD